MAPVRLRKFLEVSEIPERAIFDLLLSNKIPLSVDSEGFLCLEVDSASAQSILQEAVKVTTSQISEEQKLIEAHFEKIINEEIARIVQDSLERIKQNP